MIWQYGMVWFTVCMTYDQWPVVLSLPGSHFLVPMWKPRCRRRLKATLRCMWHALFQTMQDSVQDSMAVCNVLFIWINAPFSKFKPILIPTHLELLRLLILIPRQKDFLTLTSSIWFQFGFCTKFPWLGASSKPGSLLHHHGGDWACYAGKVHLRHCAQGVGFAILSGTEPNLHNCQKQGICGEGSEGEGPASNVPASFPGLAGGWIPGFRGWGSREWRKRAANFQIKIQSFPALHKVESERFLNCPELFLNISERFQNHQTFRHSFRAIHQIHRAIHTFHSRQLETWDFLFENLPFPFKSFRMAFGPTPSWRWPRRPKRVWGSGSQMAQPSTPKWMMWRPLALTNERRKLWTSTTALWWCLDSVHMWLTDARYFSKGFYLPQDSHTNKLQNHFMSHR